MEVGHGLPGVGPGVRHDPEPGLRDALRVGRELRDDREQAPDERRVRVGERGGRHDMARGDDEDVRGRPRVDVAERDDGVIAVDDVGGDLPATMRQNRQSAAMRPPGGQLAAPSAGVMVAGTVSGSSIGRLARTSRRGGRSRARSEPSRRSGTLGSMSSIPDGRDRVLGIAVGRRRWRSAPRPARDPSRGRPNAHRRAAAREHARGPAEVLSRERGAGLAASARSAALRAFFIRSGTWPAMRSAGVPGRAE